MRQVGDRDDPSGAEDAGANGRATRKRRLTSARRFFRCLIDDARKMSAPVTTPRSCRSMRIVRGPGLWFLTISDLTLRQMSVTSSTTPGGPPDRRVTPLTCPGPVARRRRAPALSAALAAPDVAVHPLAAPVVA